MYEYGDKLYKVIVKKFIRLFSNAKGSMTSLDELNVISSGKKLYSQLEEEAEEFYMAISRKAYDDTAIELEDLFEIGYAWMSPGKRAWLDTILTGYDPVTGYVYEHEVDRKRSRTTEAVISAQDAGSKAVALDKALRYWGDMVQQYGVTVADEARLKAFRDAGIKRVRWVTVPDERRCEECRERHGTIYDIDKVPPKPHWGCRCYLVPVR